jgi:hypothetical protein
MSKKLDGIYLFKHEGMTDGEVVHIFEDWNYDTNEGTQYYSQPLARSPEMVQNWVESLKGTGTDYLGIEDFPSALGEECTKEIIKGSKRWTKIDITDLPLYISWETSPQYSQLLKGVESCQ